MLRYFHNNFHTCVIIILCWYTLSGKKKITFPITKQSANYSHIELWIHTHTHNDYEQFFVPSQKAIKSKRKITLRIMVELYSFNAAILCHFDFAFVKFTFSRLKKHTKKTEQTIYYAHCLVSFRRRNQFISRQFILILQRLKMYRQTRVQWTALCSLHFPITITALFHSYFINFNFDLTKFLRALPFRVQPSKC